MKVDEIKQTLTKNSPVESINVAGQAITIGGLAAIQGVQKALTILGCALVVAGEMIRLVVSGGGNLLVKIGQVHVPDNIEPKKKTEAVTNGVPNAA